MGVTTSLPELEACANEPRSVYHSIADFNRYSTPNGALLSSQGVLVTVPCEGLSCTVSSAGPRIQAVVPRGLKVDAIFPGDTLHFSIVKLRGRNFFVRLQLQRQGVSGRVLRSHSMEDYRISYWRFLQCCGLRAQREQLARWSFGNCPVFQHYFQGCKVGWIGRIRSVLDDNAEVVLHLDMRCRGERVEGVCLQLDKNLKNQGPRLQPGLWIAFNAEVVRQGGRVWWHTLRALDAVVPVDDDAQEDALEISSEESEAADEAAHANEATDESRKRALPKSNGVEETDRLCVVCQDTAKTHAFLPCGHFCMCSACADEILRQSPRVCPLCRRAVRSAIRIWE